MTDALLVALGGAAGAVLRYTVGRRLASSGFPWATLIVNVLGSLLLGLVAVDSPAWVMTLLGSGVAGALTTYSAFALDTVLLERNGRQGHALLYAAGTVSLGSAAFAVGWWLGG